MVAVKMLRALLRAVAVGARDLLALMRDVMESAWYAYPTDADIAEWEERMRGEKQCTDRS